VTVTTATTVTQTVPGQTVTTTVTVRRTSTARVLLCHRVRSKSRPYRLISVAPGAIYTHLRHGDVAPRGRSCPRKVVPR
jgi:hypothetical protein